MGVDVLKKLSGHLFLIFFIFLIASCSPNNNDGATSSSSDQATLDTGGLGAVTGITGTASKMTDGSGNWQVVVSWQNPTSSSDDLSYEIQRSEKTNANPTKTHIQDYKNIKKSPYTITNIPADSTQYFIVIVSGTINNTTASVTSPEYTIKVPLDAYTVKPGPFTMTALATDGQAKIEWTDSERTSFYIIQRGTSSKSYPTVLSRLASSPYVDKNLTNGQTYYYIVIAVNSVGSTNATDEVLASPLGSPGTFTLTAIAGPSKVTLNWTSSVNAQQYTIFRSTISDATGFTKLTDIAAPTLSYVDATAVNNTLYYYKIVSSGAVETSSNTVSATPADLPQAFTVTATPGDGQVTLSWTDSVGASSYTVEYGTSPGSYPALVSNSASSGLVVSGLTNGTTYYFRVIAVNGSGSTNAPELTVRPHAPSPCISSGGSEQFWSGVKYPLESSLGYGGGLAIDSVGNIYAGGSGSAYETYAIAKYDPSGNLVWRNNSSFTQNPGVIGVTFNSFNNDIYAVGSFGYGQPVLFQFDCQTGNLKNTVSNLANMNQPVGILSDASGNVYVIGHPFDGESESPGLTINKYDASGNFIWSATFNDLNNHSGDYPINPSIAIDNNPSTQGIYFASDTGYPDYIGVLRKIDFSGNVLWTKNIADGISVSAYAVSVDASGTVYLAGGVYSSGLNGHTLTHPVGEVFLAKYPSTTATGTTAPDFIWLSQFGALGLVSPYNGIITDSLGNVYASGYLYGCTQGQTCLFDNVTLGYYDYFIIKYNGSNGEYIKSIQGNTGNIDMFPYTGMVIDAQDNLYLEFSPTNVSVLKFDSELNATPPGDFTVTATPGNNEVTLTWTDAPGAKSYTVEYGTSTGVYSTTASTSASSGLVVSGLANATPYYFRVVAVNGMGRTNAPEVEGVPSNLPRPFIAKVIPGDGKAALVWTSSTNATSYTVEYGTSTGVYSTTVSTSASSGLVVSGLANATPYYFRVVAVNGYGSLNADEVGITEASCPTVFSADYNEDVDAFNLLGCTTLEVLYVGTDVTNVNFTNLVSVNVVSVQAAKLTTLAFDELASVDDIVVQHNDVLTSFTAPLLTTATRSFIVNSNPLLTAISIPSLISVGTVFWLTGNSILSSSSFPALTTVGLDFNTSSNPLLTAISFPSLISVGRDFGLAGNSILSSSSFPTLTTVGSEFNTSSNPVLTAISFPSLISVGTNFFLTENSILSSISFPALTTLGSGFSIIYNPLLPQCSAEALRDQFLANSPGIPNTVSNNLGTCP